MSTVPDTFPSLFWGYFAIWAIIVLYLISLERRLRRLEKHSSDESRAPRD